MPKIPLVQTQDKDFNLYQSQAQKVLQPALDNPMNAGQLLSGVNLNNGDTKVNHGLGRALQGWFIVLINGPATIFDKQSSNSSPQTTLVLNSSAVCTVSLWVF